MSQVDRRSTDSEDTLAWVIDGTRVSLGDLTGMTLGEFHVEQLLGRGGMGEVYMATQTSLNRPVALKVLRPDFLLKPLSVDRFRSEALAVAKLNHPNIVHVYAIGNVGDVHYIAMEYVEGTNLREYLRKKGALELPLVFSIMKQTGAAIGAAGEAGLVHRDIKPENILITKRGRVKVADFGLCRDQSVEPVSGITQTGVTMGTPLYMSPEQAQGHPVDHRSDLYSLGVTYYYMIAGEPPFRADSAVALALKHVREIPRSLLAHRPDLPMEIDRLVMKLMAKDPSDRYQSAGMMLADVSRLRDLFQGGTAGAPETGFDGALAHAADASPTSGNDGLAVKPSVTARDNSAAAAVSPRTNAREVQSPSRMNQADPISETETASPPRFSVLVASLAMAVGLVGGALAGWSSRAPDIASMPSPPAGNAPGLWVEPRWRTVAKLGTPEDQFRYALLRAPRDEWAAAWLAVPGYFPHSHDLVSKAYTQLARIWYRLDDVDALEVLASEVTAWDKAQTRDRDLVAVIKLAINLRTGDLKAVSEAFGNLKSDAVKEMDEPTLVALRLEICADALEKATRIGNQTLAEPLRKALRALSVRLDRLELPDPAPANTNKANPPAKAGSR